MPFGKIGTLILAVAIAVGVGGAGAALKSWAGADPVEAIVLSDTDVRKDESDVASLVDDEDDDGDGDDTKGDDDTSGGNNTGDGDDTNGGDDTGGPGKGDETSDDD